MGADEHRLDVAALDAAVTALEASDLARHVLHARTLREVLELHRVHVAAGWELATAAELALVRQVSETVASGLLGQALLLSGLEQGLEAVETGLLSVEQAGVLSRALTGLAADVQVALWALLLARLRAARVSGEVLSPARLTTLLAGWVLQADPVEAEQRRKQAERQAADVEYRRRQDGLVDLFALGIGPVNARAALGRIRDRSRPWADGDDRSAGKRRLDAFVDLLLGRDQLSFDTGGFDTGLGEPDAAAACCPCRRPGVSRQAALCGCLPGQPAPCRVQVSVLVPIGAALGTTDELATLAGHGPLDRGQLADILATAPVLRSVWVDADGTPIAAGRVERPGRADQTGLRAALLRLRDAPPPGRHEPRHPHDHRTPPAPRPAPPPDPPGDDSATESATEPSERRRPDLAPGHQRPGASQEHSEPRRPAPARRRQRRRSRRRPTLDAHLRPAGRARRQPRRGPDSAAAGPALGLRARQPLPLAQRRPHGLVSRPTFQNCSTATAQSATYALLCGCALPSQRVSPATPCCDCYGQHVPDYQSRITLTTREHRRRI